MEHLLICWNLRFPLLFVLFLYLIRYSWHAHPHKYLILLSEALAALGTALQTLVVFANGLKMPIATNNPKIIETLVKDIVAGNSLNCLATSQTKFVFLCDRINIVFALISIGDVLLIIALAFAVLDTLSQKLGIVIARHKYEPT